MSAANRARRMTGKVASSAASSIPTNTTTTWAGETSIFSKSMRMPIASMLSQVYGKPVELNLTKLSKPHLDASILAAVTTEKMRQPRASDRAALRVLVTSVGLPGRADVLNTAEKERLLVKGLQQRPALASLGTQREGVDGILRHLNLKQVTHIGMYVGGRYALKLNADRKRTRRARNGITASGPGTIVRQVRKAHVQYAFRAGRRRVGAYGVKVWLGHS